MGIVTARDKFAIDFDQNILKNRIRQFRDLLLDNILIQEAFKLKDTSTFKLDKFRSELASDQNWQDYFELITYRPFDTRHIYYSKWVVERPIYDTMRHTLKENVGLTIGRQGQVVGVDYLWNLAFITEKIIDFNLYYRGGAMLFPLYIYPEQEKNNPKHNSTVMMVFEPRVAYGRKPNIAPLIYEQLETVFGKRPTAETIFYYTSVRLKVE